jgi:predicted permease
VAQGPIPEQTSSNAAGRLLIGIAKDFQFAVRLFGRERQFACVAVLALALGIAVNNVFLTIVYALCVRGLPIRDVGRVVYVSTRDQRDRDLGVSYRDFEDTRDAQRSFAGLAAYVTAPVALSDEGRASDRVVGAYVSADTFTVLDQAALFGRALGAGDDRPDASAVALVSESLWRTRYGQDGGIIGRQVRINGISATVVGVMPSAFRFPNNAEVWQALAMMPGLRQQARGVRSLSVFGRLATGASVAQARSEIESINARLQHDYPETNAGMRPRVVPINEQFNAKLTDSVWIAFITAGALALIIACANVANLLLMRLLARSHELSMRSCLGATRWRIARQLVIENALIGIGATVFGLWLSILGLRWLIASAPENGLPFWVHFGMDGRIFGALLAVSLSTVLLFGVVPALHLSRTTMSAAGHQTGRTATAGVAARRWTATFLIAEFALTTVLLAAVVQTFRNSGALRRADMVIDPVPLSTLSVALPAARYPKPEDRLDAFQRMQDALRGVGGVSGVAISTALPFGGALPRRFEIEGRAVADRAALPTAWIVTVSEQYFQTMGLVVGRGRSFDERDGTAGFQNVIVNKRFADVYLSGIEALDSRIRFVSDSPNASQPLLTIVGVSPTVRQRGTLDPDPVIYLPLRSAPPAVVSLIVRNRPGFTIAPAQVQDVIHGIDPEVPVFRVRSMEQVIGDSRWGSRVSMALTTAVALIAIVLSTVGLYAVASYSAIQRGKDVAIRVALGATKRAVVWSVLRGVIAQWAVGLVLGIAATFLWERLLSDGSGFVRMTEAPVLASIALLLAGVTSAASYFPAVRIARVDPVDTLKSL